jgi:hypothetical protein
MGRSLSVEVGGDGSSWSIPHMQGATVEPFWSCLGGWSGRNVAEKIA